MQWYTRPFAAPAHPFDINIQCMTHKPRTLVEDILALLFILAIGWFLIGWYWGFEFLSTGYQDWIYHAFRIKSIAEYGIPSWTHTWSNGLNMWRAYQYVFHVLLLWSSQIFQLSIPASMNFWTIAIFLMIRVLMYAALRLMHIRPLSALVGVIASYAVMQQWITIKDFSMFVSLLTLPLIIVTWYKTLEFQQFLPFYTALAATSWLIHPVLGYTSAFLALFLITVHRSTMSLVTKLIIACLYSISLLPFFAPYFLSGYYYANPILSSPQFLKDTIIAEHFGLSLPFFIFLAISWIAVLAFSTKMPRWAKLLLLASSLYILLIELGQDSLLPTIINKLQISRAITLIGFLLSFVFAAVAQTAQRKFPSRFMTTILLVLCTICAIAAVNIASVYSAQPTTKIIDPVSLYFSQGKPIPTGSVFYQNVSEASYFAPKEVRFVTSYNEHLEPHPLSQRFRLLNRSDIAFTGITDQQLKLLKDYSLGMGVELLFVPDLAPSITGLTASTSAQPATFSIADSVNTPSGQFTVLQNLEQISYAYVLSEADFTKLSLEQLPKPTLQAESFKPWDTEMHALAELLRSGTPQPVPVRFVHPDQLEINLSEVQIEAKSILLLTQSYDQNWQVTAPKSLPIHPTALRFMYLPIDSSMQQIILKNTWPIWHWPVQALGIVSIVVGSSWTILWLHQKSRPTQQKALP